jgi:hypothetical protein
MSIEVWVVLGVFVAYLIYFMLVSFLSDFHKDQLSKGLGKWYNFTWLCILIISFGAILTMSVHCWGTIGKNGMNCRYLSLTVTGVLVILTLLNIGWGTYHSITYDPATSTSNYMPSDYGYVSGN